MRKALLVRRALTLGLALMAVVPEIGAQSSNSNTRRLNPVQFRMKQEQKESQLLGSPNYAAHKAVKIPASKLKSLTRAADGVTRLDSVVSVNTDGTNSWKEIYSYDNNGYQLG